METRIRQKPGQKPKLNPRKNRITILLTDAELAFWQAQANVTHEGEISSMVRTLVNRALTQPKPAETA